MDATSPSPHASFAEQVKGYLIKNSPVELAAEFEVTPPTVARWAAGQNEPADRIKRLVIIWIKCRLFAGLVNEFVSRHGALALAEKFGVSFGTVRRWASARSAPSGYVRGLILEWMASQV